MEPIEIIVIVCAIAIVGSVLGNYVYRKLHHLPTGECACCKKNKENILAQCRKEIEKERCTCCK